MCNKRKLFIHFEPMQNLHSNIHTCWEKANELYPGDSRTNPIHQYTNMETELWWIHDFELEGIKSKVIYLPSVARQKHFVELW